jgi:hypothetical protein
VNPSFLNRYASTGPIAALLLACCSLATSQTLSLRNELSPQALELAREDYATMSATPTAHSAQIPSESDFEAKLLALAQDEIEAEGDRFTEKSPASNDMRLYYLLRVTRMTKWTLGAVSPSGKPDNRILARAISCNQLAKVTLQTRKPQGWWAGVPCLELPNTPRLQEANVAQQKLIEDLQNYAATKTGH